VLHCVAVYCSVVQCGAVWCSVVQRVALTKTWLHFMVLQSIAVCCSVLQCLAACCTTVLRENTGNEEKCPKGTVTMKDSDAQLIDSCVLRCCSAMQNKGFCW